MSKNTPAAPRNEGFEPKARAVAHEELEQVKHDLDEVRAEIRMLEARVELIEIGLGERHGHPTASHD